MNDYQRRAVSRIGEFDWAARRLGKLTSYRDSPFSLDEIASKLKEPCATSAPTGATPATNIIHVVFLPIFRALLMDRSTERIERRTRPERRVP